MSQRGDPNTAGLCSKVLEEENRKEHTLKSPSPQGALDPVDQKYGLEYTAGSWGGSNVVASQTYLVVSPRVTSPRLS